MYVIDRRLNPRGKSLENRQRFLRRAKALVQGAVRRSSESRDIKDILEGGEVVLPIGGMNEPRLQRGNSGVRDQILPGNKTYVEGDVIPRPEGGGGGAGREGGDGEGEDAFRFVLTREEFLDLFLDDLELPDLAKRRLTHMEHDSPTRAGYSVSGSPANLAISRTVRLAMMRRTALSRPTAREIELLEEEIAETVDEESKSALQAEIEALKSKAKRIPYIDPIDIRYRRFETKPKPVAQAVMFCLMDVSGSMTEHMKDLAKRFFMLLYIFLTRRYRHVDIVFIRHTDRAEEVDEKTFFYSQATGGTQVSSALETMRQVIIDRYDPSDWNIYAAQASDGDNAYSDLERTEQLLHQVLPLTQYFAYLEVSEPDSSFSSHSSLWQLYERVDSQDAPFSMRKVANRSEIFPVFRDLFERKEERQGAAQ
ncbi:YeaH/YhbH family protein [Terrarubrum flagellatum]|uniref:YeaH/YhbH family protein n=1 Tax=Terrirubrum flagellatum TaxID=2895980 RepID=UPI00314523A4